MELFLILLLMTLIVSAIGWAVFAGIKKIEEASTPQRAKEERRP